MNNKNLLGNMLRITYFGSDKDRTFDILVNDTKLATVELKNVNGDKFYDTDYFVASDILNKSIDNTLTVKFAAAACSKAGGIYFIRLLK